MSNTKWFLASMETGVRKDLESRLAMAGFTQKGEEYYDAQERVVRLSDTQVQVGIPASDSVSEQEQLEFLLGVLGLNEDNVHSV